MDNRHALALVDDGVFDGRAEQAFRAKLGDRLDADANGFRLVAETDFLEILRKVGLQKLNRLEGGFLAGFKIDARINVLGVFAEDDHVHLLRAFDRRRHAGEILHRAQADVEVQHLTQGHIQRTNATAHGRGQRSLDTHEIFAESVHRVIGQPVIELLERFFAGEDFEPGDLAFAAVSLGHGRIKDAHAGSPDVRTGAVAADEWNDGVFRHAELAVLNGDFPASGNSASGIGHDSVRLFFSINCYPLGKGVTR